MFRVISGSPQVIQVPVINTDTLYVGQIVRCTNEGVEPLGAASGAADQSTKNANGLTGTANNVPFGIVSGHNLKSPVFDTTYKTEKITWSTPLASTIDYVSNDGPLSKGDREARVSVSLIDTRTVIRGRIFNAAYGTAPTVVTVTTGDTAGVSATTGAVDVAGLNSLCSIYFRSGANKGTYRVTDDTSTTALTWDNPTTAAVVIGDTAVRVTVRPWGLSRMFTDSEATYIDCAAALTTNYWLIDVVRLDLSVAGKEYVDFRFNPYSLNAFDDNA